MAKGKTPAFKKSQKKEKLKDFETKREKGTLAQQIEELEKEISKTKYNKRTQGAIGLMKAKLAKLREKQTVRSGGGKKAEGYSVRKSGDGTIIIVGFPSVGKSTLLNKLTNADSEIANYAFTTLTVVPGILEYKHAKIQILDVPGIVEGAANGTGRGREVLSCAMNADMIMFLIDAFNPEHLKILEKEIYDTNLRINQHKPDVRITKTTKGGIQIGSTLPLTKLNKTTIQKVMREFKIVNADIVIRSDIDVDQLIDCIEGNKRYIKGITVLNKVDLCPEDKLEKVRKEVKPDLLISAETGYNIDKLKDLIFSRLDFIRIFCKEVGKKADMEEPLIMFRNSTILDMARKLHKDFEKRYKFARIWGKSARFDGQALRKTGHVLKDKDIVELHIR